jgi:DNA-binding NarL/FixJ family response regulator
VRVVVAEDQALLREGLARLFRDAGHEVAALAGDAEEARAALDAHGPDLLVADIRMPPTHTDEGLELARWTRQQYPGIGVLVLSQHVHGGVVDLVAATGTAGGFGYLLKDRVLDVTEFLAAAERVALGGSALDPDVVATLLRPSLGQDDELRALSPREHEVLALMAEGLTNAQIAERLYLAERTIESHTRSVFIKLGLQTDGDGHRRVLAVLSYLRSIQ